MPVFTVGGLTFGIIICNDSNYYEPAGIMASRGAAALFVPTNNGLPPGKAGPGLVAEARNCDIARAVENSVTVIRADVAGRTESLVSYGSSGIVSPDGMVLQSARRLGPDMIVADIKTSPRKQRRGWDTARNRAVVDEYVRLVTGTHTKAEHIPEDIRLTKG
jgi:predicted amidohydrolase